MRMRDIIDTVTRLGEQSENDTEMLYEAKTAPLYHSTGFWAAYEILYYGKIEAGDHSVDRDEFSNISTSRDPKFRYYSSEGLDSPGHAPVQFVINQESVAQRYRIKPNNYFNSNHNRQHSRLEREEKIHAEELPISHLIAVQLFDVPSDFSPNQRDEEFLHDVGKVGAYAMIIQQAKTKGIKVQDFRKKRRLRAENTNTKTKGKRTGTGDPGMASS